MTGPSHLYFVFILACGCIPGTVDSASHSVHTSPKHQGVCMGVTDCLLLQLYHLQTNKCLVAQGRSSQKGGLVLLKACDYGDPTQVGYTS